MSDMHKSAVLSPCGRYRYRLERRWTEDENAPYVCYIGLNPSTADAEIDDQTVRKWIGFTKRLGFERFVAVNLFALRMTKVTRTILRQSDSIGISTPILEAARESSLTVCCWGVNGAIAFRGYKVVTMLRNASISLKCWGRCANGEPVHPLMLPYETELQDL